MATSEAIADIMLREGVDFLELQIPFSDPMADGPTFMHANSVAVANGITTEDCFDLMRKLRAKTDIPLLFMGYYNSILHYGVERFCQKAHESGCTGIIFPDYPIDHEDREGLLNACHTYQLNFIPVLNPAATDERIEKVVALSPEFIYYGMRKSVTGAKQTIDPNLENNLQHVQTFTKAPLAVGWGISTPEHIRALPKEASIAIVGSKTFDVFNERKSLEDVEKYIRTLATVCHV